MAAPPSEADLQRHFGVTPPSVHQMVLTLERAGLIRRQPRVAQHRGAGRPRVPAPPPPTPNRHNLCAKELETWAGSQKMKARIVREVEVRHKREREPHVLRLGELYGRIMALTMFRGLRTKH